MDEAESEGFKGAKSGKDDLFPGDGGKAVKAEGGVAFKDPPVTEVKQEFKKPEGALPLGAAGLPASAVKEYLATQSGWEKTLGLTLNYKVLRPMGSAGAPARWTGHYQYDVSYRGVPIAKASRALVVVADQPLFIRDRNVPKDLDKFEPAKPTVEFETARRVALQHARRAVALAAKGRKAKGLDTAVTGTNTQRLVYWANKDGGRLAWDFSVQSVNRTVPFHRRYWVSARGEANILDFEDLVFDRSNSRPLPGKEKVGRLAPPREPARHPLSSLAPTSVWLPTFSAFTAFADAAPPPTGTRGRVTGTVWLTTPFGESKDEYPLSHIEVRLLKAGQMPATTTTNERGEYFFLGVTGDVQVSATLTGPYARVMTSPDTDTLLLAAKAGNGRIDLDFRVKPNNEENLSQVSAFCWVNEARDFAAEFLPQPSNRLSKLPLYAFHDGEGEAEAFWSRNNNITLDRGVGDLPNKAYRGVIFHEYGHALDNQWGEIHEADYSEGFGDAFAVLLTREPLIMKDYNGKGTYLRDVSQVVLWSNVQNSQDKYDRARVYAGFAWELINGLKVQYKDDPDAENVAYRVAKQLILGPASSDPVTIPDAVRLSFVYDAEQYKGPPGQKSKHFDALAVAAKSRGLDVPSTPTDLLTGLFR